MDRVATIGRYQWRAFWRRFKRTGHLNAGNQGIVLIFSVIIFVKYLQLLNTAANDLPQGKTAIFESLLLGILLVWLFPLASNARPNISPHKLLHLPLSLKELFGLRLIALVIPPYSWAIVAGSLAICYPIIRAPNPVAGVAAALLFILWSAFMGLTIAHLLSISVWRKLFFMALMLSGFVVSYLVNKNEVGRLLSRSPSLPTSLVTRAALGNQSWIALAELGVLTTLAFLAALWSFKKSLVTTPKGRTQRITFLDRFRIPGPAGALAAKDFRYFRRLLDPYLGVLASALGSFYLITASVPSAGLFQIFLLGIFVPNAPLAFNSFGLDTRSGLERLRLMPVSGKTIILNKNLAFLMIVAVQLTPMIVLATWRLGLSIGVLGLVEAASLAALYLAWGNWMSVNHPFKMQFFQFSSSNGAVVDVLAGIMFGSLPGIIDTYFAHTEGLGAAWKIALVLLVTAVFYSLSLSRAGTRFEQKQDGILNAIS